MNFSLSGLVGFDLFDKTAGVLGTGKIGRIVAEILRGFGMRVLAFDAYPNQEWATQNGIEYVEPRTPETDRIVNKDTLALTKPGVILINVSRVCLIHTRALIEALKSGHVGGVALDVYEEEEGIFFEDLSGEVLHDDETGPFAHLSKCACDRASGLFNARSP